MDFTDEAGVGELINLEVDEVLPLDGLLADFLLDRSGARKDLQSMLNHIPWDPRHVGRLPGKHVDVSPEECDEREFLFVIQTPTDAGGLGCYRADLYSFGGDSVAAGWLGDLLPWRG